MPKHIYFILIVFVALSCVEKREKSEPFSQQRIHTIVDSLGNSTIITCFFEAGGLSVIQLENNDLCKCRKLVYRIGYATFIDSLVYVKPNEFKSPRLNTNYLIKDSTVISVQQAKIIHPSSNWQGQTPWQQPYVSIYPRLHTK